MHGSPSSSFLSDVSNVENFVSFLELELGNQVSISPTLNAWLFCTKISHIAFFVLTLVGTFLVQEYWRKCVHKMLVKLTTERTFLSPMPPFFACTSKEVREYIVNRLFLSLSLSLSHTHTHTHETGTL